MLKYWGPEKSKKNGCDRWFKLDTRWLHRVWLPVVEIVVPASHDQGCPVLKKFWLLICSLRPWPCHLLYQVLGQEEEWVWKVENSESMLLEKQRNLNPMGSNKKHDQWWSWSIITSLTITTPPKLTWSSSNCPKFFAINKEMDRMAELVLVSSWKRNTSIWTPWMFCGGSTLANRAGIFIIARCRKLVIIHENIGEPCIFHPRRVRSSAIKAPGNYVSNAGSRHLPAATSCFLFDAAKLGFASCMQYASTSIYDIWLI